MASEEEFISTMKEGYSSRGKSIVLGAAVYAGKAIPGAVISAPMKTLNRHGLIAGATGSVKTKTLQGIAEKLSLNGV